MQNSFCPTLTYASAVLAHEISPRKAKRRRKRNKELYIEEKNITVFGRREAALPAHKASIIVNYSYAPPAQQTGNFHKNHGKFK
jgi:hypothetical protein